MQQTARSDAELIIASCVDSAAFRELYERWAEQLLTYFYRRVRDPEVAADLLAETFAVAFSQRHKFRDIGRPGGSWLYGIAAKELAQYFRRARVEMRAIRKLGVAVPPLDEESIARIEELIECDEHAAELTAAMARMSRAERDAVELRVVHELGYGEIAATLRCSEAAARTRVHRGLARLNDLMEARP
jgi:RNA polymerase sigma-70 factor (ECF subfamily)